jgi:hypothetical protein
MRLQYIYTRMCQKEIHCVGILNKQKYQVFFFFFFSSTKLENRRAEHVLPGELVLVGGVRR